MAEKQFAAGEAIFREDDISDVAYIVRQGKVEFFTKSNGVEVKSSEAKEGDAFGEMALLDPGSPRVATARAKGDLVVDVVSNEEFHALLDECPARLIPIVATVFERIQASNQRIKAKESIEAVLEMDAEKVIITPANEAMQEVFSNVEMVISHLPLRVGGFAKDSDNSKKSNHLSIPCEGPPLAVSANHFEIAVQDGGIYVRDLGSRFGTSVNGFTIGRGRGEYKAALEKGENQVILGDKKTSPYQLTVTIA